MNEALAFLLTMLFECCALLVLLCFLLQLTRRGAYDPVLQVLSGITDPLLRPLRRVIPGFGGVDWASIVFMLALVTLEIAVVRGLLMERPLPSPHGLLLLAAVEILRKVVYLYFVIIVVHVLVQWLNPGAYSPIITMLRQLSEPLLRRARRLLPPISGLDFSPLVTLIAMQLLVILLIKPLMALAYSL